ncbi:hypothetical protein HJ590_16985 [Naumannella sp. ID2617S]|nr:hypothetical protein [Naumannella sp. ID2617S]
MAEPVEALSPAEESLLAAVVALETTRFFDGNEPSATVGLDSQLIGIRRRPSDDPWRVPLVVRDAPPVALSDGPLLGRYWVGEERRGEVVVRVVDGLLASLELVWAEGTPQRWPEPGELTVG